VSKDYFESPLEAEAAFYQAFVARDLKLMMQVWDNADDIVCIHPLGPALVGVEAVRASFEAILGKGTEMKFVVEECHRSQTSNAALHVVLEHIRVRGKSQPPVAATNAYRLTRRGWRMVLHHASPAPEGGQIDPSVPTLH
jgi:ketosteroid isomerase-like protein